MKNFGIYSTATYVPETRMTVTDLKNRGIYTDQEVKELLHKSIDSIAVEKKLSYEEMLHLIVERLMLKSNIPPQKVRYILFPYVYYSFSYDSDIYNDMTKKFGFDRATCFSIRDALCTNYVTALQVAKTLSANIEADEFIVIITIEKCHLDDQRYGGSNFITGDAATGTLLGFNSDNIILNVATRADFRTIQEEKQRKASEDISNIQYYMNFIKLIKQTLKKENISIEDITLFIPTNTTLQTWEYLAKLLKLPREKIFTEGINRFGHNNNCDLVLNYEWLSSKEYIEKGNYYAMLSFANGGVLGSAVFKKG